MDNDMDSMLETYLFETNSLMDQLDEILLEAEKSKRFTVDDVNEIFRIMHTIKGSSAMMEFDSLMTTSHKLEDLFFLIRDRGVDTFDEKCDEDLHHGMFDLLFKVIDFMRSEIEKIENSEPLTNNIDNYIENINSYVNKIKVSFGEEADPVTEKTELSTEKVSADDKLDFPDQSPYFAKVKFDEGIGMENLRAFMVVNSLQEEGIKFKFYPEDIETNSDSSNIIIETGLILSFMDKSACEKAMSLVENMSNINSCDMYENLPKLEDASIPETNVAKSTSSAVTSTSAQTTQNVSMPSHHNNQQKQSLISVNLSKLDKLMAIVGEIVITESMVTSSPDIQGVKLDNFTKSARQLRKLTDELQDIAMSIRMVPIAGVFNKMNRIVRDMGQKLGKEVELEIVGEETEVDKAIVDGIGDPIMHIVRNSMDHGIEENVQDRINAGKSPKGRIVLSAEHTGSEVIISIEDDGQGVNTDVVLQKAANNGLLVKPESEYTKREILNLLMMPGFSTNTEVTEYSGRGVGMDVVKKNVEKVGGVVNISSEVGVGTKTTLKIPLTMAIVDGMEIAVGNSIFTIPITNIRQSFKATNDEIINDASGGEIIKRMDEFYPVFRLHQLYNIPTEVTNIEDGILIWVEAADKSYCLFVDELLGEQQVVVKPLPTYLSSYSIKDSGISGCTILGNGSISIILDIPNLYQMAQNY
ncbi:MAG: chemotaxis protein CheA [Clostridiales bacterium]|nr:chemotaxis protein CheA [Clostridiales bacterium]